MSEKYEITVVSYVDEKGERKIIGIPLTQDEILHYIEDVEAVKLNKGTSIYFLF